MGNSRICGLEMSSHLPRCLALGSLLSGLQNTNSLSKAHKTEARWQCSWVLLLQALFILPALSLHPLALVFSSYTFSTGLKGGTKDFPKCTQSLFAAPQPYKIEDNEGPLVTCQIKHHFFMCLCFTFSLLVAETFCSLQRTTSQLIPSFSCLILLHSKLVQEASKRITKPVVSGDSDVHVACLLCCLSSSPDRFTGFTEKPDLLNGGRGQLSAR